MSRPADTPEPPYYAVIFTSQRTPGDDAGYGAMADAMVELAAVQDGYIGIESVRDDAVADLEEALSILSAEGKAI